MEPKEFIGRFDTLVLDMGDTFMFQADRFGPEEDFAAVYRDIGGKRLADEAVNQLIRKLYNQIITAYRDNSYMNDFPTVSDFMFSDPDLSSINGVDMLILEELFSRQEIGIIPDNHIEAIKKLSGKHKLSLISNIWAESRYFSDLMEDKGILRCFSETIFSSDIRIIKPSPEIFKRMEEKLRKKPQELVYIGNHYHRDCVGAKQAGWNSILVQNGPKSEITGSIKPDLIIKSILELAD